MIDLKTDEEIAAMTTQEMADYCIYLIKHLSDEKLERLRKDCAERGIVW